MKKIKIEAHPPKDLDTFREDWKYETRSWKWECLKSILSVFLNKCELRMEVALWLDENWHCSFENEKLKCKSDKYVIESNMFEKSE